MYKNFYSMNDMPQIKEKKECNDLVEKKGQNPVGNNKKSFKLESDDIILLAVLLILLMDDCEDKTLILVIGIIFISGLI